MSRALRQGSCQPMGDRVLCVLGAAPGSWHAPALLCMSQGSITSLCPHFTAGVTVTAQEDGEKALLKGMKAAGTPRIAPRTLRISPARCPALP